MAALDAKAIAARLLEQEAAIEKWRLKAQGLEVENRDLRGEVKARQAAEEKVASLTAELGEAREQIEAANRESNRKTAELAGKEREILKLRSAVSAYREAAEAEERVTALVSGGSS
jgi:chromosome segregation ATPase